MPQPQFRDDGAVKITLRGEVHWLSRDDVLSATYRVTPSEPIQVAHTKRAWWVTIRRKRYPVNQVARLALGLRGGLNTPQVVVALKHLGFPVDQEP